MTQACAFGCGKPLDLGHPETLRFEVVGWERLRSKGGQNHVLLRKRTGAVAHADCVERGKRGGQGSFDGFA